MSGALVAIAGLVLLGLLILPTRKGGHPVRPTRASYQQPRCRARNGQLRCNRPEQHDGMHRADVTEQHGGTTTAGVRSWWDRPQR